MNIDLIKKDRYIIIPFWILMFFIFWLQVMPQTASALESVLFAALLIITICPVASYLSGPLLLRAMKQKEAGRFAGQFVALSLVVGLVFVSCIELFSGLEKAGVFPVSGCFNLSATQPYAFFVPVSAGVIINIAICGLRFFLEYVRSQQRLAEYRLCTLRHQMTPHFMFNVLNDIHVLMQTDVELASELLIRYSEILRYQLYSGDRQSVTLGEDVQFLKDFIAVEQLRRDDRLTVSCSWEIENAQMEIPALLFIAFVENAFKHVAGADMEKGYIDICLRQAGSTIFLEVKNSKPALPARRTDTGGRGLKNIKERLDILCFGKYDLTIDETENCYHTKLVIDF